MNSDFKSQTDFTSLLKLTTLEQVVKTNNRLFKILEKTIGPDYHFFAEIQIDISLLNPISNSIEDKFTKLWIYITWFN